MGWVIWSVFIVRGAEEVLGGGTLARDRGKGVKARRGLHTDHGRSDKGRELGGDSGQGSKSLRSSLTQRRGQRHEGIDPGIGGGRRIGSGTVGGLHIFYGLCRGDAWGKGGRASRRSLGLVGGWLTAGKTGERQRHRA